MNNLPPGVSVFDEHINSRPKSKTEMNKRLRRQRKDAGLVELRIWLKPKEKVELINYLNEMRK